MHTYVLVSFWLGVVCFVIRIALLGALSWPHKSEKSIGTFIGEILLGLGFCIWAGIALWG